MFYLSKCICFVGVIGSLFYVPMQAEEPKVVPHKEEFPKVEEESHQTRPSLVVTSDGTRRFKTPSGYAVFAKPTSSGVWEILGNMGEERVSGAVKVLNSKRYAFSGTVFLKNGPFLTTQSVKVLSQEEIETKDLVTDAVYTFTEEELQGKMDPSMPPARAAGFCVALSILSVKTSSKGS